MQDTIDAFEQDDARAAILAEYNRQNNIEDEKPEEKAQDAAPAEVAEKTEEPEIKENQEYTAADKEQEAGKPEPVKQEEAQHQESEQERKLKGALSEERARRKAATAEINELKARMKALEDLALAKTIPASEDASAYETLNEIDEKAANKLVQLERQLAEQEAKLQRQEEERIRRQQEEASAKFEASISSTARELLDEGYPGFDLMVDMVAKEVSMLAQNDPDNVVQLPNGGFWHPDDTPDGWKRIYREKVFPLVQERIVKNLKQQQIQQKVEAKQKANLVSGSGLDTPPSTDENNWSTEDAVRSRMGSLLA